MFEFDDEYGHHVHNAITGPPFDMNKPLTCEPCIAHLKVNQTKWRAKFTAKRNLPENFWDGI